MAPAIRQLATGLLLALSWAPTTRADSSAADYYVKSLPGQPAGPPVKMHAGHIETDADHNGNLFFWHFENKHIAQRQRTVIWLNGGPGCSSEDGAMMEIGPYRVKGDQLVNNNGSWHEFANLLFVDNPVGTGFSYVDTNSYLHELDEMGDQFILFLEKFFKLFPQYAQDDLYFAGESYAGQHIPYIAKHILERNEKAGPDDQWNLKGLVIGNGWISPFEQYGSYLKFAYEKGLLAQGSEKAKQLEQQWKICRKQMAVDIKIDISECEAILQKILDVTATLTTSGKRNCYNMYDVRLKDTYPSCGMNWPPDLTDVTPYLRRKDVTEALHINAAKNTGWKECNGAVGSAFRAHKSKPSRDLLPDLLKKVPITLFSGAEDLICNHIGTEEMIGNMEWNGAKGFEVSPGNWAPRRDWTFEGKDAGFWQEARNLTYVLFKEASHMVPFDWPRRSRDMIDRVMKVDISAIGGEPTDSRIDGEKGPVTSVPPSKGSNNHPDTKPGGGDKGSSTNDDETQKQVDEAKWKAYYRSGEIVLVIVVIAAGLWGWYIWRDRRRRSGYQGVAGGDGAGPGHRAGARGLDRFQDRRTARDVETGDFDESELDDLHVETPREGPHKEAYAIGDDSDEEDIKGKGPERSGTR
ncbi:carboxypeptidase KEX1 [Verticillium alfalfae VaMs.102]|uniref:Pheromone-processing carboxypeptidase KEX1 n=1 Tax=Verticillium alfalfae (strain VaMs.102 / ATCC MYA-4576 / FGSC 10136) TaxID=526221 RepID=KEX1_VERA1|nr:carboxypeptidase KEX1 [Verticillium alfalfae VaMs.102]C9S688.1 RecName: Full=Pheromone-processing carboxypeptidase KEX1; AltName: Full=Carboxypeptidase D; Flags: Precursor [Verticillium alfalfae VaMs.102]EEY14400.1 carboxypeptidase KEX1 [Verticillium alfalfae VaMs.102]